MMFLVNMVPGLGQRMISRRRRFSAEELVAGVLATVCADPSRISPDVVEQHVEVARRRFSHTEADREFTLASRSVVSAAAYVTGRGYRRAIDAVRCPVLVLHGLLDRLVPVEAVRQGGPRPPGLVTGRAPGRGSCAAARSPRGVRDRDPRMARRCRPRRGRGRRRPGHPLRGIRWSYRVYLGFTEQ